MTDEIDTRIGRLRRGDGLKVPRLHMLAPDLVKLRERLTTIHSKGGYVLETETGRRSDTPAAGDMVLDAAEVLRRGKKGPPPAVSRENGAKGGRPERTDRMPDADAKAVWLSLDYVTNEAAIRHMPGWSIGAAHYKFGPSGRLRTGRPKKRKTRKST